MQEHGQEEELENQRPSPRRPGHGHYSPSPEDPALDPQPTAVEHEQLEQSFTDSAKAREGSGSTYQSLEAMLIERARLRAQYGFAIPSKIRYTKEGLLLPPYTIDLSVRDDTWDSSAAMWSIPDNDPIIHQRYVALAPTVLSLIRGDEYLVTLMKQSRTHQITIIAGKDCIVDEAGLQRLDYGAGLDYKLFSGIVGDIAGGGGFLGGIGHRMVRSETISP